MKIEELILDVLRSENKAFSALEICKILNKKPDSFLGDIFEDIETGILKGTIKNNNESLKKYIKENY